MLHEFGDGYAEVLAKHRRALRDAFAAHNGVEVDTQGDAVSQATRDLVGADALRDLGHHRLIFAGGRVDVELDVPTRRWRSATVVRR